MSKFRLPSIILWVVACLTASATVQATGSFCSVTGATSVSLGSYNPFTGSSFSQVPVNLTLTRYAAAGNRKTQHVDFYLVQPAGSPAGFSILYQNANVLYTLPSTHPLSLLFPPSGAVFVDFGGNGNADTRQVSLVVTVPPGLNLVAGDPLQFDMVYICDGTSTLLPVILPTTLPDAISLRINVLSALQASYAGPALDFGSIEGVSDTQAPAHSQTGLIRVASSGPYTLDMRSSNGYLMTFPGGRLGVAAETIKYAARLAGQTRDHANLTFGTVACLRAGVTSQTLPITVTLREGGVTKTPAPNYADTLTVTVTPLATPFSGSAFDCPTL